MCSMCGVCVCVCVCVCLHSDLKANLRASWNESLEEASERKILIKKTEEIQREVTLANKALIMVRYKISVTHTQKWLAIISVCTHVL